MEDRGKKAAEPARGSLDAYMVRAEAVSSPGLRLIARKAFDEPEKAKAEDIRKMAAAILAHKQAKKAD